jgi:hypothetical protein
VGGVLPGQVVRGPIRGVLRWTPGWGSPGDRLACLAEHPAAASRPQDVTTYLPLPEAAARLGVSQASLRRRLRSGAAHGERRPHAGGFAWWVACAEPVATPGVAPQGGAPLAQAEHIADLRRRVEDQSREIAELHRLLAQAHQLALPAPAPIAVATPANGIAHGQAVEASRPSETQSAPPARDPAGRPSWWRRMWWGYEPA